MAAVAGDREEHDLITSVLFGHLRDPERQPGGRRNYKLAVKDPLPASFGEDLYYQLGGWLDEAEVPGGRTSLTPDIDHP